MTNFDYEVCIPVKNEENLIAWTLDSINNQSLPPSSIYICLNGTTDRTRQVIEQYGDDKVQIVESEPGKANAWNKLFHKTSSLEHLLFCDGDTSLDKFAAEKIFERLREDENLTIVGGALKSRYSNPSSFFTRYFSEQTQEPIIWGLSGAIYGVKKPRLIKIANEKSLDLIPPHIINEDFYLDMVASPQIDLIYEAYADVYVPDNFKDWVSQTRRVLLGTAQAKREFPTHFKSTIDFRKKLSTPKFQRLNRQNTIKKIGICSLFILRRILSLEANYRTPINVWDAVSSTKNKPKDKSSFL